jgi:hypothetical protein
MPYLVVTVLLLFYNDDIVSFKGILLTKYVLIARRITY